jgi:hypothetical protein
MVAEELDNRELEAFKITLPAILAKWTAKSWISCSVLMMTMQTDKRSQT